MRIKPLIVFVLMIVMGLSIAGIIGGGYYPIAIVNGSLVLHRDFRTAYRGATTYYGNTRIFADEKGNPFAMPKGIEAEILNTLVEQTLIHVALQKELGKDLARTVQNRMRGVDSDEEFKKAAITLSGLRFEEFRSVELVPQAERDILTGRFFLEGKKFDEWLLEAKRTGDVKIFSRAYFWDGGEVKGRE